MNKNAVVDLRNLSAMEISEIIHNHQNDGFTDKDKMESLSTEWSVDPKVVENIWEMIVKAEVIKIATDYDADGVTSAAILYIFCRIINPKARILLYIPYRSKEGYGFSKEFTDRILADEYEGNTLLITGDNGINNADSINRIKAAGCSVVITDHHMLNKGNELPDADVIIDPVVKELPNPFNFDKYCGAGISYTLLSPLITEDKYEPLKRYCRQLAAIATVADVMELSGANYKLYHETIDDFRNGRCHRNLKGFIKGSSGGNGNFEYCDETVLGFYVGPVLNAPGRLRDDGGELVVRYLSTVNFKKPDSTKMVNGNAILEKELIALNKERKQCVKECKKKMFEQLGDPDQYANYDRPIWIALKDVPEGIVGILAGKVAERYKLPAFVLTEVTLNNEPMLKGSGRTFGDYNLYEYMQDNCQYFYKYGGHIGAAGCTLTKENYEILRHKSDAENIKNIKEVDGGDYLISADEIEIIVPMLSKLKPFGLNNPEPKFKIESPVYNIVFNAEPFGKEDEHMKCRRYNSRIMLFDYKDMIPKSFEGKTFYFNGTLGWDAYDDRDIRPCLYIDSVIEEYKCLEKSLGASKPSTITKQSPASKNGFGAIPPLPNIKKTAYGTVPTLPNFKKNSYGTVPTLPKAIHKIKINREM